MKCRMRPLFVDAVLWPGHSTYEVFCLCGMDLAVVDGNCAMLAVGDAIMLADPGDWIVRCSDGTLIPLPPAVAEQWFEVVDEGVRP